MTKKKWVICWKREETECCSQNQTAKKVSKHKHLKVSAQGGVKADVFSKAELEKNSAVLPGSKIIISQ